MRRRSLLSPETAPNEGARKLCEILGRMTFTAVARRLACDPSGVRRWALGEWKPDRRSRVTLRDKLGISTTSWDSEISRTSRPPRSARPPVSSSSAPATRSRHSRPPGVTIT